MQCLSFSPKKIKETTNPVKYYSEFFPISLLIIRGFLVPIYFVEERLFKTANAHLF